MIALTTVVLSRGSGARPRATSRRAGRRGGARVAARGAGDELLAVEHRRAAARPGGARRLVAGACARRCTCRSRVLALAGVVVLLAPASLHFGLKGSSGSANNATSGRTQPDLRRPRTVRQTPARGLRLGLVRNRVQAPQQGGSAENAISASHTIPVTVAAEQGIIGLALYVALLRGRVRGAVPRRRALAAADRDRGLLRGAGAAHVDLRGLPRGPVHVDAAGDRRGAGAPGDAGGARRRPADAAPRATGP